MALARGHAWRDVPSRPGTSLLALHLARLKEADLQDAAARQHEAGRAARKRYAATLPDQREPMRVIVNQLAALGAKTGIGHYTVELLRCLRQQAGADQIDSSRKAGCAADARRAPGFGRDSKG